MAAAAAAALIVPLLLLLALVAACRPACAGLESGRGRHLASESQPLVQSNAEAACLCRGQAGAVGRGHQMG